MLRLLAIVRQFFNGFCVVYRRLLQVNTKRLYLCILSSVSFVLMLATLYEYFSFDPFLYSVKLSGYTREFEKNSNIDPFFPFYSKTVLDRNKEILSIFLNNQQQWHLNSEDTIPSKLKESVLLYEDKRFYNHHGIDILAVLRTIKNNMTRSKMAGASTITMQVIKILESNPRTFRNKLRESIHALRLESLYSKDTILAMYLNNVPYGGNIVGFKTASLLYFGRLPNDMTWAQSALLAVLPNQPGVINISRNRSLLQARRDALLKRLHEKGLIDSDLLRLALREPLPKAAKFHKNVAQHLALRVIKENNGQQAILQTTIDKKIQTRFEEKAKQYQVKLARKGITNLCALLLDTKSREVLAYVGSQDFLDIDNYGQIDGIRAKRSPGSLLKPLLYGLSIDSGLIAPESLLIDVPLFFSNFNPRNASNKHYGVISARNALILSLNVPFVRLLQEYGMDNFFYTLKDILHFSDGNPAHYGLSLILGTKELSVEDIAKIYLGIANGGEFGRFYYSLPIEREATKRFLSRGASYLTLDAIKNLSRSGIENFHKEQKIFSWKSGTSYGKKDAWAAGSSPKYTLVVWVGNFTGEGNANLSGVESAGSLLFELLGELNDTQQEFSIPQDSMQSVLLDKMTGYRYNPEFYDFHIESLKALLPRDSKPLRVSPFLRKVYLDKGLQREIDSIDNDFVRAIPAIRLFLPTNVLDYYSAQNVDISTFITTKQKENAWLKFIYPTNHLKIIQPKDIDSTKEMIVRIANLKNQQVHWYHNKQYLGILQGNTQNLHLSLGVHELSIIGADGSTANVRFSIEK
ncbi:penicillin-binding protein 1C [Helicobacter aurati]|uniref:peptidoglycan glycosyltransferase n=1 Tax=Helicobacter aurati TaxID=137778 RepID=A0A3D8J0V8_9HELI|nr:penicillin-binding protein 1C [Helicobacter aurati]RDU71003.1 penicillin-binding protein 1C [Helicobacter aurati]